MGRRARHSRTGKLPVIALTLVTVAGCGGDQPAESAKSAESAESVQDGLVGEWHRAQSCQQVLAAFEAAGLAESQRGWLQGNFFGGSPGPADGDPCAGADGPLEHDHYFTGDGRFGSHDENGEAVDDGDYRKVDADTVAFPSHAREFRYDGDILVDYAVDAGELTFDVNVPSPCDEACAQAYAWALSAFASGPWQAGEVPR